MGGGLRWWDGAPMVLVSPSVLILIYFGLFDVDDCEEVNTGKKMQRGECKEAKAEKQMQRSECREANAKR